MKILTGDTIIPLRSGELLTVDEIYKRFTNGEQIELLGQVAIR